MQTIGERLEEARKKKGVSVREAAEATKIRGDYLQKFENNQFDIGLTDIYVRGFLKSYAAFLHLPPDRLLSDYGDLGRGEARPRQPSREVYGRMDLSVAPSDEQPERSAQAPEAGPTEAPRHAPHMAHSPQVPHVPRSHASGLPAARSISPAAVFKGGILLVGVLLLLLIVWVAKSLFTSGPASPAERAQPPPQAAVQPAESTFNLIALDTVAVRVSSLSADGRSVLSVLFDGALSRGRTQTVPWPGKVWIQANPGTNLNIEYNGRRIAMPPDARTQAPSNQVILPGPAEMR
jgi:transcriptional regulator with XRE-family HTH domain